MLTLELREWNQLQQITSYLPKEDINSLTAGPAAAPGWGGCWAAMFFAASCLFQRSCRLSAQFLVPRFFRDETQIDAIALLPLTIAILLAPRVPKTRSELADIDCT